MASVLPEFQYDIFISYRQKDNKYDGWVSEFVSNLRKEIAATFKEEVSIYFDENPVDGLLESHTVDKSLEAKLRSLVFIPIISHTYCDKESFAWQHEFLAFIKLANQDKFGLDIELGNGNFASRVLPVRIHEIDAEDQQLFEKESGNKLRAIDFIYKSSGVNRPLLSNEDDPKANTLNINYRDQVNKVTNAIKEIVQGMKSQSKESPAEEEQESDSEGPKTITEKIERRDLLRVSLVYIIFAMVMWRASSLLTQFTNLPDNLSKIIGIALVGLFPVALILAWKYERAPGGLVRIGSEASKRNPLTRRQRKPLTNNSLILILIILMVALFTIFPKQDSIIGPNQSHIAEEDKSIAVLYFDNMSGDPSQEYFSDGITEEIIARLAKVEGLKVISRTSVRVYKGEPLNLKKIAEELDVAFVLEGSVRKAGDQVRITAQLIHAETDQHIWAETFDREMGAQEVLEAQAEIAESIVERFEIEVTPEVNLKVHDIPTTNTEAYESYLEARHIAFNEFYYFRMDTLAFERSKALYEDAIAKDPNFAEAIAGLADLYDAASLISPKSDSIRNVLSIRAYKLDPNSAFTNYARVWALTNRQNPEMDSAMYHAAKAYYLEPTDFNNPFNLGGVLHQFSQPEMALPYFLEAYDLNPLDPWTVGNLGRVYQEIGEERNARKYYQEGLKLPPPPGPLYRVILLWLISEGQLEEAEKRMKDYALKNPNFSLERVRRTLMYARRQTKELANEIDYQNWSEFDLAYYTALLGDTSRYISNIETIKTFDWGWRTYYLFKNIYPYNQYSELPEVKEILRELEIVCEETGQRSKQIIDRVLSGDIPY